jgi:hypothetical protein
LVGHCLAQCVIKELWIPTLMRNDIERHLATFNETARPAWAMLPPQGIGRSGGVTEITPAVGVMRGAMGS